MNLINHGKKRVAQQSNSFFKCGRSPHTWCCIPALLCAFEQVFWTVQQFFYGTSWHCFLVSSVQFCIVTQSTLVSYSVTCCGTLFHISQYIPAHTLLQIHQYTSVYLYKLYSLKDFLVLVKFLGGQGWDGMGWEEGESNDLTLTAGD